MTPWSRLAVCALGGAAASLVLSGGYRGFVGARVADDRPAVIQSAKLSTTGVRLPARGSVPVRVTMRVTDNVAVEDVVPGTYSVQVNPADVADNAYIEEVGRFTVRARVASAG